MDIARAQAIIDGNSNHDEDCKYPATPGYHVGCHKPFMSLICRTFPCNKPANDLNASNIDHTLEEDEKNDVLTEGCSHSRVEFYHTLKSLIRMGSGEKHLERNPRRGVSIRNLYYF